MSGFIWATVPGCCLPLLKGFAGPACFFSMHMSFIGGGAHIAKTVQWDLHPVLKELHIIIKNFCENKLIIIEDIRDIMLFYRQNYPNLLEMIHVLDDTLEFFLFHDCMIILPKEIFYEDDLGTFLWNDALPMYDLQNNPANTQLSALQQDRWYRFGRLSRKQKLQTIVRVLCRKLVARN